MAAAGVPEKNRMKRYQPLPARMLAEILKTGGEPGDRSGKKI